MSVPGNLPLRVAMDGAEINLWPWAFLRPALWLVIVLLAFGCFVAGIEMASIFLALAIALLATFKPQTGLWASTAYLVFVFVFFHRGPLFGYELPAEYLYWGAGVAIITVGLIVGWLRAMPRSPIRPPTAVLWLDRAILLLGMIVLLASGYGIYRGNDLFTVARQLFGCLLLPAYYLISKSLLRTPDQANRWFRSVSWSLLGGTCWYAMKLAVLTLSQGAYYREQSPIGFYAGILGAPLFVEFLYHRSLRARLISGASLVVCILAILLVGVRFVAGSLAATAAVLFLLRWRKQWRRGLALFSVAAFGVAVLLPLFDQLPERSGILGEIAARFIFPLDEDLSYIGRVAQWQVAVDTVREHPLLGAGMGGEITYSVDGLPWIGGTGAYIDHGWGFLLLKMGVTGLVAFILMIIALLRVLWSRPRSEAASTEWARQKLFAVVLFGLFSFTGGPTFFHFTQAGFLGTALGGLAGLSSVSFRGEQS